MKHAPREHQRMYLTFYLRVFEDENFLGFLIDISENGMMIMSDNPLVEEKFYLLKMKLPGSPDWKTSHSDNKFISFTAECKWTKQDEEQKEFYISGFEFTELDTVANDTIHALIEEYRIR